jgi:hypothetical protein
MSYSMKSNEDFALKLLLMEALAVRGGRVKNKRLLAIIKMLET